MSRFPVRLLSPAVLFMMGFASAAPARPDRVIVIQADDLGYDDLGASGNPLVRTPHLDRLAEESVQVLDFTVNPVCAPSRATLLTGRHFLRTGVSHVHGGKDYLHWSERTAADLFTAAGWTAAMWGKWHLGTGPGYEPWERGFGLAERLQLYRHREAVVSRRGETVATGVWADDYIFRQAIDCLRSRPAERVLVYLPTMTPHTPLAAPDEASAPYRTQGLSTALAELYGMVTHLDAQVGRLLRFLDEQGMAENTLVIFTSDNGPAISRGVLSDEDRRLRRVGALRGWKGDLWQGGVRVPLYIRWPARLRPGVMAAPLDQADLLPTLLAWCGIEVRGQPYPWDGVDRSGEIEQHAASPDASRPIYNYAHPGWLTSERPYSPRGLPGEYNPVGPEDAAARDPALQPISVRRGRFKLVRNPDAPVMDGVQPRRSVLIDLFEDPGETTDVSARHPGLRVELDTALDGWFADLRRSSQHAFGAPVHRVTGNEVVIPGRTPSRVYGAMQNTVALLHGWQAAGSGAAYQLEVGEAGAGVVELAWGVPPAPGTVLEVSLAGSPVEQQLEGPSWTTRDALELRQGPAVLLLRVVSAPANAGEAGLAEVRLRRLRSGS